MTILQSSYKQKDVAPSLEKITGFRCFEVFGLCLCHYGRRDNSKEIKLEKSPEKWQHAINSDATRKTITMKKCNRH